MNLISIAQAAKDKSQITLNLTEAKDLNGLLTLLINWVGIIAGLVAFFYLIYSGFLYLTSAGNAEQSKKGGAGILNAVIGIIVIVLSWTIVSALNNGL